MSVDIKELTTIFRQLPEPKANAYLQPLNIALMEFGINTPLREAAFLAQIGEESGELRWWQEFASGSEYEGRRDLGNVNKGDGVRYHGRCPIMLTGRANYRLYGTFLGLNLERNPDLALDPLTGFRISGCYWKRKGLNELADAKRFVAITRRVNGGLNGLAARQLYYVIALREFMQTRPNYADMNDTLDIKVVFNGSLVLKNAFLDNGATWAPVRKLSELLGISIGNIDSDSAELTLGPKKAQIPLEIHGSTGFSPLRELAAFAGIPLQWDPAKRSVLLGSVT